MDSHGHGRSTCDAYPYGYDLMADVWLKRTLKRRSPESDKFLHGVVTG